MTNILVESAVRSLALGVAVGIGLWISRTRGARLQMTAWTLVLTAAVLMPLLMQWRAFEIRTPVRVDTVAPALVRAVQPDIGAPATFAQPALPGTDWKAIARNAYLGITVLLLLRLLTGLLLTLKLWRNAKRVREPWMGALDIRETSALSAPATFASSILLPLEWRGWNDLKLRAVIAHERAHVDWRDFYVLLLARLHLAVFWFSPLAWLLRNRLAALAEAASDDAALATAADRPSYAELLIDFASRPQPATGAVAMARMSTVSRRVERILSEHQLLASPGWKQYAMVASCAACLGVFVAGCSVNAQTAPQAKTPETPAAKKPETRSGNATGSWWWQHDGSHGDPFAIVSGDSLTMSGSSEDAEHARSFRSGTSSAYIWFEHDGKQYLITDPAAVKRAQELFRPQEELGRQQAVLGKQQAMLGDQQARLGQRQAGVTVRIPDLEDKVRALQEQVRALDKQILDNKSRELANTDKALAEVANELRASKDQDVSQEKLAHLQKMAGEAQARISSDSAAQIAEVQARIGELQSKFGEAQARAGDAQAKLADEQAHLGAQQAKLGAEQAKLGEEQARLAEQATRQLRKLFDESVQNGLARPTQ